MTIEYDRIRLRWPDHLGLARGKPPPGETMDCIEDASTDIVAPASLKDALDSLETDTGH